MAALSTFHPAANPALSQPDLYQGDNPESESRRNKQILRILGKFPTMAAGLFFLYLNVG